MAEIPSEADFFNGQLTNNEKNLYDRQFRLPGFRQEILKNSRVLIAGVGGLGCEIAKNLAMVGVGRIHLVDMDTIEYSNLNRQVLFANAEIGESKAIAAARELKKINPTIIIVGHHCTLEQLNPMVYKKSDVIVGGLDSVRARRNLNAQAVRFRKPLVDGGVSGYNGHIYTIFPYENACYECNPTPVPEIDDMNACTVVGIPRKRTHCLLKANMKFKEQFDREINPKNIEEIEFLEKEANELAMQNNFLPLFTKSEIVKLIDRHEPGIITINAVIASLQSHETIKILNWIKGNDALGPPQREYVVYNGMTLKFYWIERKRNLNCSQCGDHVKRIDVTIDKTVKAQQIVKELILKGFESDPEMVVTITKAEFNGIKEIDLDQTIEQNNLRNYELLIVVGFKGGSLALNLILT